MSKKIKDIIYGAISITGFIAFAYFLFDCLLLIWKVRDQIGITYGFIVLLVMAIFGALSMYVETIIWIYDEVFHEFLK